MSGAARPGTGGRQTRIDNGYLTEATAQLVKDLGPPESVSDGQAVLKWWEIDRDGDGVIIVRLSSQDIKRGETAFGQVHELRAMVERLALKPRWLLVGLKLTGKRPYARRIDLQFVEYQLAQRPVKWVAFRDCDRMARKGLPFEQLLERLKETGIELYLSCLGRRVDYEEERLYLQVNGMLAEQEATQIAKRTRAALDRRWVAEGRGWPGSKRFGFLRDEHGFLAVDPVQWPFVERVHYDYADFCLDGRGGQRRLADHLAALGCALTKSKIADILKDPIYVTGEWWVKREGQTVPQRPPLIPRPIPREVFERNQQLLALNKLNGGAPTASNLLAGLPVWHARCVGHSHKGKPIRLQPTSQRNAQGDLVHRYNHWPATPSCCSQWGVPLEAIDYAVIRGLLALADSEELQAEYAANAFLSHFAEPLLSASQISRLETDRDNLKRQLARITRGWLDDTAAGSDDDRVAAYQRATQAIERETEAIQRRLELQRKLTEAQSHQPSPPSDAKTVREMMRKVLELDPDTPETRRTRRALVHALLSGVTVHDDDNGIAVTLDGPLIPEGSPPIPVNPLADAQNALLPGNGVFNLAANGLLSGQVRLRPAWRSGELPVLGRVRIDRHHLRTLGRLRRAHSLLYGGRLRSDRNVARWRGLAAEGVLPKQEAVREVGTPMSALIREAVGDVEALRWGRVSPQNRRELVLVMRWALDAGVDLRAPGLSHWRIEPDRLPFFPSGGWAWRLAAAEGVSVADCVAEAEQLEPGWSRLDPE